MAQEGQLKQSMKKVVFRPLKQQMKKLLCVIVVSKMIGATFGDLSLTLIFGEMVKWVVVNHSIVMILILLKIRKQTTTKVQVSLSQMQMVIFQQWDIPQLVIGCSWLLNALETVHFLLVISSMSH